MRKRKPGTYGFTTTPDGMSLVRIAKEAGPKTLCVLAHVDDTKTGVKSLAVFVRKDVLPKQKEGLAILDNPVGRTTFGKSVGAFRVLTVSPERVKKAEHIIKGDIQKLKNHIAGRSVRVLVEAL